MAYYCNRTTYDLSIVSGIIQARTTWLGCWLVEELRTDFQRVGVRLTSEGALHMVNALQLALTIPGIWPIMAAPVQQNRWRASGTVRHAVERVGYQ